MEELTIVIDYWGNKELKEYLMSLNGILDVSINDINKVEINIKYKSNLISSKIIKMEILLFLDILKIPSILSFDKHFKGNSSTYTIVRNDICCEYCFKGAIEDLFEISGIEKVESNFNENYYQKNYSEREALLISIKYNQNLINIDEMKQIEQKLNI